MLIKRRKRKRTGVTSRRGPGRKRVSQGTRMHSSQQRKEK